MLDAKYFRTTLPAHAKSAGPETTVEVHLVNGQSHSVRAVLDATDGYVVLDLHHRHGELLGAKGCWMGEPQAEAHADSIRAVLSYEAITQVLIVPSRTTLTTRIGFGPTE